MNKNALKKHTSNLIWHNQEKKKECLKVMERFLSPSQHFYSNKTILVLLEYQPTYTLLNFGYSTIWHKEKSYMPNCQHKVCLWSIQKRSNGHQCSTATRCAELQNKSLLLAWAKDPLWNLWFGVFKRLVQFNILI